MPDRAPGFYWVRVPMDPAFRWTIAEYNPALFGVMPWLVLGENYFRALYDLDEIGPRVESPEEVGAS
jgi:hypothetical protein